MDLINSIKEIVSKLPYWFNAKHIDNDSDTYKFLSVFGESVSKLEETIEHAYNLTNLDSFENRDYILRKIILPENEVVESVIVNKIYSTRVYTEHELLNNLKTYLIYNDTDVVKSNNSYIYTSVTNIFHLVDDDRSILYIAGPSKTDNIFVNGKLYSHVEHRVWSADILDEFGLIYSMPRLDNENNSSYKNRLLEYSKTISNSTFHGMANTIGHNLNKYHIIDWNNGGEHISISSDEKMCRYIFVDDAPYSNVTKVNNNTISISGDLNYTNVSRKIKYFTGFDFYNLDSLDITSQENINLFDKISKLCPIMWGIARWGDIEFLDNNVDDYYYIAPTFDPDLSKLKR